MADKILLLDSGHSPFGMRARIALAEKGIDYEYRDENLREKSELLLKSNPIHQKIPVLIHNGKPVCESVIIVEYLDEVWNEKSPLMPKDPWERAKARFWVDFIDKKVYDCGSRIWKNKGEAQEQAKWEFIECLKLLEGELGEKTFFGGETLGFIDVAFVTFGCWFYSYETEGKFSVDKECPKIIAWFKRCMEKESVFKVLPDPSKVYEDLLAWIRGKE